MPTVGLATIVGAVVVAIFGTVGFSVTKDFVTSQDTSGWSAAEVSIVDTAIPIAIALLAFVGAFAGVMAIAG